jgi:hypothetical protein
MRWVWVVLGGVACDRTVVGETRPDRPVGASWTWSDPAPPAPRPRVAGRLEVDPQVGWSTRLASIGPVRGWGTRVGRDRSPAVAARPGGGFVVAFEHGAAPCEVWSQDLDPGGRPVDGALRTLALEPACAPAAAVDGAGRVTVVSDADTRDALSLHRVDPVTGIERVFDVVTGPGAAGGALPAVAATPEDVLGVAWLAETDEGATVWLRAYDALLVPTTAALPLTAAGIAGARPAVVGDRDGFVLAWTTLSAAGPGALWVARWDGRSPLVVWATEVAAPPSTVPNRPSLVVGAGGEVFVAWQESGLDGPEGVHVASLGADGALLTPPTRWADGGAPALAAVGSGAAALAWVVDGEVELALVSTVEGRVVDGPVSLSGPGVAVAAPALAADPTAPGRVAVAAAWVEEPAGQPAEVVGRVSTVSLPAPPGRR